MKRVPIFTCVTCMSNDTQTAEGWDFARYDSDGQPVIWPYLDHYESPDEKFGRCPKCVTKKAKMPIGNISHQIKSMMKIYQKENPGTSEELAFAKVQELMNEVTSRGEHAGEGR